MYSCIVQKAAACQTLQLNLCTHGHMCKAMLINWLCRAVFHSGVYDFCKWHEICTYKVAACEPDRSQGSTFSATTHYL